MPVEIHISAVKSPVQYVTVFIVCRLTLGFPMGFINPTVCILQLICLYVTILSNRLTHARYFFCFCSFPCDTFGSKLALGVGFCVNSQVHFSGLVGNILFR
jgi:hypothetical protein